MNPLNLILASASPRRRRFLLEMKIPHLLRAADIDEAPLPHEDPADLALRLACDKAAAVADRLSQVELPGLIIASDTVVALDGETLGKPVDEDDAIAMLRRLGGRTHQVHSAIVLLLVAEDGTHNHASHLNTTDVDMRNYSDEEIVAYVSSGDPFDKAGGYAIQHRGFEPVAGLRGCPAGVMGLPLADLRDLLAEFGVNISVPLAPVCRRLTGLPCCQKC
ncbi:septum formation protein Maf [bacterium]|nr:septum formation protein Maf [bacterium]